MRPDDQISPAEEGSWNGKRKVAQQFEFNFVKLKVKFN